MLAAANNDWFAPPFGLLGALRRGEEDAEGCVRSQITGFGAD